jgi:dTMP kinase
MTFIVIEGLDGCGGETQTKLLKEYLIKKKIPHKIFHSPDYSTPVGKSIQAYLKEELELDPETAFIVFASDTLLTSKKIEKLREKNFLIMDRYITSTIPYQAARGLDFNKGVKFTEIMDYQIPDAIIYIDIKPKTSMERKKKEKEKLDFHEKKLNYLKRVRNFYLKEAENYILTDWFLVDGERSIEDVHEDILIIIKKFL